MLITNVFPYLDRKIYAMDWSAGNLIRVINNKSNEMTFSMTIFLTMKNHIKQLFDNWKTSGANLNDQNILNSNIVKLISKTATWCMQDILKYIRMTSSNYLELSNRDYLTIEIWLNDKRSVINNPYLFLATAFVYNYTHYQAISVIIFL